MPDNRSFNRTQRSERISALPLCPRGTAQAGDEQMKDLTPIVCRSFPSLRQQRLQILEHQEQVVRIARAWLALPRHIPLPRCFILGMHQQATNAGNVSGLGSSQQRILQQRLAQSSALAVLVHSESRQDHDRYRMPGRAHHDAHPSTLRINAADRTARL